MPRIMPSGKILQDYYLIIILADCIILLYTSFIVPYAKNDNRQFLHGELLKSYIMILLLFNNIQVKESFYRTNAHTFKILYQVLKGR